MTTPETLAGWRHVYSGKVRDLYVPSDEPEDASATRLLVVASDRVSAFDHVLAPAIPGKGTLLTSLSMWWFDQLAGADGGAPTPNHLIDGAEPPASVAGRAMVTKNLDMQPIECVVRGYLTGSGWLEYQAQGTVCGIALPEGLANGDRLPEPIFTPAYKAPLGEHDENISFDQAVALVGSDTAEALRALSLDIYHRAATIAETRGLILADTKFEFGRDVDGTLTLADEVLTSDSSRYWDGAAWAIETEPSARMASFDKQIVRDWLAGNWDKTGAPPELPAEIVQLTAKKYAELLERISGSA